MTLKRNLSSVMGNAFVNTFKFMTNVAMVMLFATLTSCTQESLELEKSAATDLLVKVDSIMELGKTTVTVEGSAINAQGQTITGRGELIISCQPNIYEDYLGMPTVVDKNGISSDGNVFTATTYANGDITIDLSGRYWVRTILIAQLNDSTELKEAQFQQPFKASTDKLPSAKESEKSGEELVRVLYKATVKKATPVEPISYRKSLTLDFEDAANGEAYGDMLVEKVQGSTILDNWDCFGIMAKWGKYNPQVSSQSVNSFDFTSHDLLGETKDLEADLPGLGKNKTFTRKNVRHTAETFEVRFNSNPDADGNTVRPIRGQIDVWVYEYVFVNPEDNHTETFTVEVEVKSVKSEVNNSTYEREIHVVINGQTVDVQNGKVQLTIG